VGERQPVWLPILHGTESIAERGKFATKAARRRFLPFNKQGLISLINFAGVSQTTTPATKLIGCADTYAPLLFVS
jgi:hypothetical protein